MLVFLFPERGAPVNGSDSQTIELSPEPRRVEQRAGGARRLKDCASIEWHLNLLHRGERSFALLFDDGVLRVGEREDGKRVSPLFFKGGCVR